MNNPGFVNWLNKKADDIFCKVNVEPISDYDMLFLIMKETLISLDRRNTEMSREFDNIHRRFEDINESINQRFEEVNRRFVEVDRRFEQMDRRFEQIDKRFDRLTTIMMWQGGIIATLISGLYLKLFF